jgi:hypothetical protein
MIEKNKILKGMTTVVDVFEASVDLEHKDHVHLTDKWYKDIGNWFSGLILGGEL